MILRVTQVGNKCSNSKNHYNFEHCQNEVSGVKRQKRKRSIKSYLMILENKNAKIAMAKQEKLQHAMTLVKTKKNLCWLCFKLRHNN